MRLSGSCPSCGNEHRLELTTTSEVDTNDVVELAAGPMDTVTGTIPASPELIKALTEAGALRCPQNLPKGRTVGYVGPNTIYT